MPLGNEAIYRKITLRMALVLSAVVSAPRTFMIGAMLAGLTGVVACNGGSDTRQPLFDDVLPPGWGPIEPALAETSDYQRAILEDGDLTFQEYERALLDTVACLQDAGVRIVSGPQLQSDGRTLHFSFSGGATIAGVDAAGQQYDICYAEHLDLVSLVWLFLDPKTEQELQAARRSLVDCLREAGVDVADDPSDVDFVRFYQEEPPESFHRCRRQVIDRFGLPDTWGP